MLVVEAYGAGLDLYKLLSFKRPALLNMLLDVVGPDTKCVRSGIVTAKQPVSRLCLSYAVQWCLYVCWFLRRTGRGLISI